MKKNRPKRKREMDFNFIRLRQLLEEKMKNACYFNQKKKNKTRSLEINSNSQKKNLRVLTETTTRLWHVFEEDILSKSEFLSFCYLLSRASLAKCNTSGSESWLNFSKHGLTCAAKALKNRRISLAISIPVQAKQLNTLDQG